MFTRYCVLAFKNIWKYRVSAAISILGLAFALTCLVPILYDSSDISSDSVN